MINWTMFYILAYLISAKYHDPKNPHESVPVPSEARIGGIFIIAVLIAILYYYLLNFTELGYKLRVSGLSPKSARYAGFNPSKLILSSMLLGGLAAGLGGALLVLGITYAIDDTLSTVYGVGFTGIGIGLLGRNNPIGIIFSGIFMSGLIIGGQWVELKTGAPPELADTLVGVIVITLAVPQLYREIFKRIRREKHA